MLGAKVCVGRQPLAATTCCVDARVSRASKPWRGRKQCPYSAKGFPGASFTWNPGPRAKVPGSKSGTDKGGGDMARFGAGLVRFRRRAGSG